MTLRIVFMGSPEFAVPSFTALCEARALCEVVGAVTQPDKPAGRGRQLTPCAVKVAADARGVAVLQPTKMKVPETRAALAALRPDVAVVAAYGRILPPSLLDVPRLGCVNVHASLLPRHRGASPIAHALLAGDPETGVCIMKMDPGLDTGPVYARAAVSIGPDDTTASLSVTLAELGAKLLVESLAGIADGSLAPVPQPEQGSTYAPLLKKEDGALAFDGDAESLARRVRAFDPWPGTFAFLGGQRLGIVKAVAQPGADATGAPGSVVSAGADGIVVACGRGALRLLEIKPEGKRAMAASAWVAGRGISVGQRLSSSPAAAGTAGEPR